MKVVSRLLQYFQSERCLEFEKVQQQWESKVSMKRNVEVKLGFIGYEI